MTEVIIGTALLLGILVSGGVMAWIALALWNRER